MKHLLEICVDSVESAKNAQQGGADRLELCSNLIIGGTTPDPALIRLVKREVNIPVRVLLRPRFGDFCFTDYEKEMQLMQIEQCRQLGADGVVVGALLPDGNLDEEFLRACAAAAKGMGLTMHRAFDVCADAERALETAVSIGFDTILTSGQAAKAPAGKDCLAKLCRQAEGRITIMAGSGVNPDNMPKLAKAGICTFHFSAKECAESPMQYRAEGIPMGLPVADEYLREYTDASEVARAKKVLSEL